MCVRFTGAWGIVLRSIGGSAADDVTRRKFVYKLFDGFHGRARHHHDMGDRVGARELPFFYNFEGRFLEDDGRQLKLSLHTVISETLQRIFCADEVLVCHGPQTGGTVACKCSPNLQRRESISAPSYRRID